MRWRGVEKGELNLGKNEAIKNYFLLRYIAVDDVVAREDYIRFNVIVVENNFALNYIRYAKIFENFVEDTAKLTNILILVQYGPLLNMELDFL